MQSQQPDWAIRERKSSQHRIFLIVSALLIVYGAVGVAVNLRLLPLLFEGLGAWFGGHVAWDVPQQFGWLGPLQAHYDARPWLPWAAWLVGVALLPFAFARSQRDSSAPHNAVSLSTSSPQRKSARWIALGVLALLLVIGGVDRMVELWPQSYGLTREPYDDEGVYAGTSQLFLQGALPYRDYFFAHPPIAAIAYAPAMAYHFTAWGSPTSFMMARYLSVFYSLVTLAFIFGIAYKLAGLWGGALAGGLWAIDGRVIEINRKIMLEGPLVMLSCAGVLLYLWARPALWPEVPERVMIGAPARSRFSPTLILALAGSVAALSALTKIAGLACLLAIIVDMVWLQLENRRRVSPRFSTAISLPAIKRPFVTLGLGVIAAVVVVLGPFLVVAPSQFFREVIFFQMLRPSDGVVDTPARIGDLTSFLSNALTPLLAALGFVVLSIWAWTRRDLGIGPWRLGVIWMFFSLILFTYSRSFYQHYYIQLAAPLCLFAAGVNLVPTLLKQLPGMMRSAARGVAAVAVPVTVLLLLGVPFAVIQWTGMTTRACPHCEDHIFEIVGKYVNDAVPPGAPVLSSDEQFNILAARPPSHSPTTGYLIDSYGQMIFLALNMDTRDWRDLIASSLRGDHGTDPYAVMRSARPQADFLERAANAALIVVHERGFARLSDQTLAVLNATYELAEKQPRYTLYRGQVAR
ncbi:MAG: hypothetical protein ABJA50_08585 [Chloroflexota bacterium]